MREWRRHATAIAYLGGCAVLIYLCAARAAEDRTIVVTRADLDRACAAVESIRGTPLSAEERVAFERSWLEERVLIRDARRRGLDRQDPLLRDSVLGRVLSAEARIETEPTGAELRAYHARHRERYVRPASVDLSVEPVGERDAAVLPVGPRLYGMSERDLRLLLGADASAAVFAQPVGVWSEPVALRVGLHRLRVDVRRPPEDPPFEAVERVVRLEWRIDEERRRLEPLLRDLRRRYVVRGLGS